MIWSLCMPGEPGRQGLLSRKFLVNLGLEPPSPRSPASSTTCAWSIATTGAAPADHPGRENTRSPATSMQPPDSVPSDAPTRSHSDAPPPLSPATVPVPPPPTLAKQPTATWNWNRPMHVSLRRPVIGVNGARILGSGPNLGMVARRCLPRWGGTCGASVPLAGTLRQRRRLQVRVPLGFACLSEGCLCCPLRLQTPC